MTLFALLLVAVAAAILIASGATYLVHVVRDDGAHGSRRTPPRSHYADTFDPRSRLA